MRSQNDAITSAKAFITLLKAEGLIISAAFLFGSHARNEAAEDSDIDVAVVSPDFTGFRYDDLGLIARSKLRSDADLEVIPLSESAYNAGDPFVREIVETGLKIA